MREKRERQERENASRARQRAEIKRSRRSMGLDPQPSFMVQDWRGLGAPVDNTGKKPENQIGVVRFFASERGSLGWRGAENRRKARTAWRRRKATWEAARRELSAKGENTGTQANHNARREETRAKKAAPARAA